MNYLAPRRAIKTTALDCEIRGGEYIAFDRADYRTSLNVWMEKAQTGGCGGPDLCRRDLRKGTWTAGRLQNRPVLVSEGIRPGLLPRADKSRLPLRERPGCGKRPGGGPQLVPAGLRHHG